MLLADSVSTRATFVVKRIVVIAPDAIDAPRIQ
jgi:hypothetical protein